MIRQHSVYFCTDFLQTHMTIIISIIKTYMTSVEADRALNSSLNGQTREPHEMIIIMVYVSIFIVSKQAFNDSFRFLHTFVTP